MRLPSASALQRADACPASCALPQVRTTSDHAERGTIGHEFLENWSRNGRDRALELAPPSERAWLESLEPPVDPQSFRAEVALAIDVETGEARELGECLARNYPPTGPGEMPGTADILRVEEDRVIVGDWKFDFGPDASAAPIQDNLQVAMLALAAAKAYGRDLVIAELIHLPDGTPWIEVVTFDAFDLAAIRARLKNIAIRVRTAQSIVRDGKIPYVTQGPHCRWCPALPHCPASTALVTIMADQPELVEQEIKAHLTPETAAQAYRKWKFAKAVIDRIGSAIYAYAEQVGGIALDNGKILGPTEKRREQIDAVVARKILTHLAGPDAANDACTFETSKAAIERALKPVAEALGQPLAPMVRKTLDAIREAGGANIKVTTSIAEYAVKSNKGAA